MGRNEAKKGKGRWEGRNNGYWNIGFDNMDETRFQLNANTNVPNEWNIIHESNNYIKMPIGGWNVITNYIFKLILNMKK